MPTANAALAAARRGPRPRLLEPRSSMMRAPDSQPRLISKLTTAIVASVRNNSRTPR